MGRVDAAVAQMTEELRCLRPPQTPRGYGRPGTCLTYLFKAPLDAVESGINMASK